MLNRRLLRAKAMQSLFGLFQVRNAMQEAARENLATIIEHTQNQQEGPQRASALEKRVALALSIYDEYAASKGQSAWPTDLEESISTALAAAAARLSEFTRLEVNRGRRELEAQIRYANEVQDDSTSLVYDAELYFDHLMDPRQEFQIPERSASVIKEVVNKEVHKLKYQFEQDRKQSRKRLVDECEQLHRHYFVLLRLTIAVAKFAEQDEQERQSRLIKPTAQEPYQLKLSRNPVLLAIDENPAYQSFLIRNNVYKFDESFVRQLFTDIVAQDETYQQYSNAFTDEVDLDAHRNIARHIATRLLLKADLVQDWFSEQDLYWDDNREVVRNMVVKTLKSVVEPEMEPTLSTISADWDDDREFTLKLLDLTVEHQQEYVHLLSEQSENWDASRFSHTDMVIMVMCLTEVINFQQIPVKVSINEYLEVARQYSTPQSFQFINGVLDALAQKLQDQGMIKKTGRGLLQA